MLAQQIGFADAWGFTEKTFHGSYEGQMRQTFGRSGAVLLAGFVALGSSGPSLAADTHSKNEKFLMELDRAWSKASVAKDVDRIVSYYADDASMFPTNAPVAKGKAAIKKVWTELVNTPGFSLSWEPTTATASKGGDLGYTSGTYQFSMSGPDGKPLPDTGKYVVVWKKDARGKWKVVADIFNSDLPAAPSK
jgi:ketosteroid isomerase-like protein